MHENYLLSLEHTEVAKNCGRTLLSPLWICWNATKSKTFDKCKFTLRKYNLYSLYSTILLVLISSGSIFGQYNLVRNWSFEEIDNCQVTLIEEITGWSSATQMSPVIAHACSEVEQYRTPNAGWYNRLSYQVPRTGDAYAILWLHQTFFITTGNSIYLQNELTESLQSGETYFARFFISPDIRIGDSTSNAFQNYCGDVGVAFSPTVVFDMLSDDKQTLDLQPSVTYSGEPFRDTSTWTPVAGSFVAQGDERFMVIGNFKSQDETIADISSPGSAPNLCPVYIDDVSLHKFDPLPDTIFLCGEESSVPYLNGSFLDGSYLWSSGNTDSVEAVTTPGLYTLEVTIDGVVLRDTTVALPGTLPDLVTYLDTVACYGKSLTLRSPIDGQYVWNDGSNGKTLSVDRSGHYELTVYTSCDTYSVIYTVTLEDCTCQWYIPTAFSPNNDDVNDWFEALPGCDQEKIEFQSLKIFNRWGGLVHFEEDVPIWEVQSTNGQQQDGAYLYVLKYVETHSGIERTLSGTINLIK